MSERLRASAVPVNARTRLVAALGGLELTPDSPLRLTENAAGHIADAALDALADPVEQLRPADEVARIVARNLGVGDAPAPVIERLAERIAAERRDAVVVAYAESRRDRDRLRAELDEVRELLAEVVSAVDLVAVRGHENLREVAERAKGRLGQ